MKCIFKWYHTDGYTYGHNEIIPFECDDLDKFIYDAISRVQKSKEYSELILGVPVTKEDLDNLEHCFFTLDEWFEQNKNK